ncbi:hypothetical protein AZH90_004331 [Salmonella enterica subsp. enterica serovar Legon]|nr:hypothetical protein [Salmonella enterica subsp. enterica serovar Legon]EDW9825395.1 hypothetical protein [Salmonella enterica]EDZ3589447.1 hypothetical protein [Salmonella enterica subsp. enterica serovar Wagenia]
MIHLIVTCTRRKTVDAGGTIFPSGKDAGTAYEIWRERLAQACSANPLITAGELYAGQHWNRASDAAKRNGAELWIISAGLGLLHVTDRIVPYEATFSSMPFRSRDIWTLLITRPPTKRRCPSFYALMRGRPHDRFVIAASPVYLRAVEDDLCAGRDALTSPDQLTIVTSKGYQGCLSRSVTLASAAMMGTLNTNLTGLNVSYAAQLIERSA